MPPLPARYADHPELLAAASLGIPAEPWQQVIADAAATTGQRLVAVAGTHGKSTTTGWIVDMLVRAGRDPSAFVGALLGSDLQAEHSVGKIEAGRAAAEVVIEVHHERELALFVVVATKEPS